jgi:hypothetical protein
MFLLILFFSGLFCHGEIRAGKKNSGVKMSVVGTGEEKTLGRTWLKGTVILQDALEDSITGKFQDIRICSTCKHLYPSFLLWILLLPAASFLTLCIAYFSLFQLHRL